ncbi:hypothetical protein AVEN_250287-1 [Araneus ventricosus]|uniref:Uncharacterized protein n=2 Tax=Araneus ventricosus TaxID=182803 RepID=A0A4Y2Q657_ARAVE|nr:hypothetical protein AVEN_250287-1 [Araneus ventricosus]
MRAIAKICLDDPEFDDEIWDDMSDDEESENESVGESEHESDEESEHEFAYFGGIQDSTTATDETRVHDSESHDQLSDDVTHEGWIPESTHMSQFISSPEDIQLFADFAVLCYMRTILHLIIFCLLWFKSFPLWDPIFILIIVLLIDYIVLRHFLIDGFNSKTLLKYKMKKIVLVKIIYGGV